jgi:hypothetical protein
MTDRKRFLFWGNRLGERELDSPNLVILGELGELP